MKINFPEFNKIKTTNFVCKKGLCLPIKTLNQIPDKFEQGSVVEKSVREFFTELEGCYSQEDLKRIDSIINYYKSNDIDLIEERKQLIENMLSLVSEFIPQENSPNNTFYKFDSKSIPLTLKKAIKENSRKLYSIKTILYPNKKQTPASPFSEWFDTKLGVINPQIKHSIFEHPIDKALSIIGSLTKEDYKQITKEEFKYKKFSNKKVEVLKLNILNRLAKMFEPAESDFIGTFTDKQIEKMTKDVIKYVALNNIHTNRNISTKTIERLIYSSTIPEHPKIGDYINGLGLIINKIKIETQHKETPAIIIFSNEDGFNTLRMYDLDKLVDLKRNLTKSPIEKEKECFISEIRFGYLPNKKSYLIRNFRNFHPNEYPNAGKIIGTQLIKLLIEKDCHPIFLNALAYDGSRHSPVNFYKYYGFKPINQTEEELEEFINKNNGVYPYDKPLEMELVEFNDEIKNRARLMEEVYL